MDQPQWKRRLKRVGRVIGKAMAGLLALVLVLLVWLHSGFGESFVRGKVAERLGQRVNGTATLGAVHLDWFAKIGIDDLVLSDANGEVIRIGHLSVDPNLSDIISGTIAIDSVRLSGVTASLVQNADGTTNLTHLFKKTAPPPPQPDKPKKSRRFVVRQLLMEDIGLTLVKTDGNTITLKGLTIEGNADATPVDKTAKVEITRIAILGEANIDNPTEGITIALKDFKTGINVDMLKGNGTLLVAPTSAMVHLTQKGATDREVPIKLEAVRLAIHEGKLDASLDDLLVGAIILQSVQVSGRRAENGNLTGDQRANVVGLKIDKERVNELLKRQLLISDIELDTEVSGPAEKLVIASRLKTDGGTLQIDGTVNGADATNPKFDLTLKGNGFDSTRVVAVEGAPKVEVGELNLRVKGNGATADTADLSIDLLIKGIGVRGIVVDDVVGKARMKKRVVTLDGVTINALGQTIAANGDVDLNTKDVHLVLSAHGDVHDALSGLTAAGRPPKTMIGPGLVVLKPGDLEVKVDGKIDGKLDTRVIVDKWAIAGGAVSADVVAQLERHPQPTAGQKKVEILGVNGELTLQDLDLVRLARIRNKKLKGIAGVLGGNVRIDQVPDDPRVRFNLQTRVQTHGGSRLIKGKPWLTARIWGSAKADAADVELRVQGIQDGVRTPILLGDLHLPLILTKEKKGLDPYRKLRIDLHVPKRKLAEIWPLMPPKVRINPKTNQPRPVPKDATIDAAVHVVGNAVQPEGTIFADIHVPYLNGKVQRLMIDSTLDGDGRAVSLKNGLKVWLDRNLAPMLTGHANVRWSSSPLVPGPKALSFETDLKAVVPKLESLPLPPERKEGLHGEARAHIVLRGNRRDLTGRVKLDAKNVAIKGKGPLGLDATIDIGEKAIDIKTFVDVAGQQVVKLTGGIARPGLGLLAALGADKSKPLAERLGDPTIDLTLEVPKHPTILYGKMVPLLALLPGSFSGGGKIGGKLSRVIGNGGLQYGDYTNMAGDRSRWNITIDAMGDQLAAAVKVGPASGGTPHLAINVNVPRAKLTPYRAAKACYAKPKDAAAKEDDAEACVNALLPVAIKIAAPGVDLKKLVPEFVGGDYPVEASGTFRWNADGVIKLNPMPRYAVASGETIKLPVVDPSSRFAGALRLDDGRVSIPQSRRKYHDVTLKVDHSLSRVSLSELAFHESDLEHKNRFLKANLAIDLENLRPMVLSGQVSASRFLLYGTSALGKKGAGKTLTAVAGKLGEHDAPRGELTADIRIKGNLAQKIRSIDVNIAQLALLIPDRFTRAHEPETVHVGDLFFVGDEGVTIGKLPVAPPPPAAPPTPAPGEEKAPPSNLDLRVHIAKGAHVQQHPLNLFLNGDILVARRGNDRKTSGTLTMEKGDLSLGGKKHLLEAGTLIFDDAHPKGEIDLLFARTEHEAALRETSRKSAGSKVNIHLQGPIANRRTTLSGAGSPGTLFDLLSMHNAGRPRYVSHPDMPASTTASFPQHLNLLLLSYLSVNAPNLLFADRVVSWADAYDSRATSAYGQVRNHELEIYNAGGTVRGRVETRGPRAGASEGSVYLDWLWGNDSQTAFGVGLGLGTRGGGGPGFFLDWSSTD